MFTLVISVLNLPIYAISVGDPQKKDQNASDYVVKYISLIEGIDGLTVSSPLFLKSVDNDNNFAVCYNLSTGGYAIVDIDNFSVYEYSLTDESPYKNSKKDVYYVGPFNYYDKIDNKFIHIKDTSLNFTIDELKESDTAFNEYRTLHNKTQNINSKIEGLSTERSVAGTTYSNNLTGSLSISWVNGYCGPTSVFNLLKYMGKLRNYTGTDATEIKVISNYTGVEVSLSSLVSGINIYLSVNGISGLANSCSYNFDTVMSKINANKPITLGTNGGGLATGGHVQTIHGYTKYIESLNNQYYALYVNNSWGQNNITITYEINSLYPNPPSYLKDHVYVN